MTLNEALQVLGLPHDATVEEIQNTFRTRAKDVHPDTTAKTSHKDGKAFRVAREAYKIVMRDAKAQGRLLRRAVRLHPTLEEFDEPRVQETVSGAFRIFRLIPRNACWKVNGAWATSIYVPVWFAEAGGIISIMGIDNEDGSVRGLLLPHFRLILKPFDQDMSIVVSNMTPVLTVGLRIVHAPKG